MKRTLLIGVLAGTPVVACDGRMAFDTHTAPDGTPVGGTSASANGGAAGAQRGEGGAREPASGGSDGGGSDSGGAGSRPNACGAGGDEDDCEVIGERTPCSSAADCPDRLERWCDLTLAVCVECRDARDCPPAHECNARTRRCH